MPPIEDYPSIAKMMKALYAYGDALEALLKATRLREEMRSRAVTAQMSYELAKAALGKNVVSWS